jgi:hypothetical protein
MSEKPEASEIARLILARAEKATNKSLRGLYLRQHLALAKGS